MQRHSDGSSIKRAWRPRAFRFAAGAASVAAAGALAAPLESPATRVHLLELYSSQGCSSCPPAQQWISSLTDHEQLWERFVPVVLHVDYWDYLGWKDPYGNPAHSARQRDYVRAWRARTTYTPMFVRDGMEWRPRSIEPLLERDGRPGVLRATPGSEAGRYTVEFTPTATATSPLRVHGAVLAFDVRTPVRAGENAGRTLAHDFLALQLVAADAEARDGVYRAELAFDTELIQNGEDRGVAFWVSDTRTMDFIQAVGKRLDASDEWHP